MVYTDFRPTPLQHYIYPAGGDGLFLVEDEKVMCSNNEVLSLPAMEKCYLQNNFFSHCNYSFVFILIRIPSLACWGKVLQTL